MLTYFNKSTLDWIIIGQGERSISYMAANPSWTKADYKAGLLDLINFDKASYPGVKILIIQTVQSRSTVGDIAQNTTEWAAITQAQQELAASESNVFIIQDTSTFTITNGNIESSDGVHYTKAGNVIVGESAATKIYQNL